MNSTVSFQKEARLDSQDGSYVTVSISIREDNKSYYGDITITNPDGKIELNGSKPYTTEEAALKDIIKYGIRMMPFYPTEFMLNILEEYQQTTERSV